MEKVESVFKNGNFVLTFLGALVSNIAAMLLNFATSFYVLKITNGSASTQGIYLFVCGIVFVTFSLFTGVLSDRFNKAKIMFICDYAKGALIVLCALLILLLNTDSIAQLFILFIFGGIENAIAAIFSPASGSLLPFILKDEQLQQGNSYLAGMNGVVNIVGALLGGILYSVLPFYILLIIIGAGYVCSGISEMFIRYEENKETEKLTVSAVFKEMGESIKYIVSMKAVLTFVCIALFINFFFSPISNNFLPCFVTTDVANEPNYLFKELVSPELWSSIISICFCVGSIIGALIMSSKKQMDKVSGFLKIQFSIMAFLALGLALSYFFSVNMFGNVNLFIILILVIFFLIGIIVSFVNIPTSTTIARVCDKSMLGKVSSLMNVGCQGLIPLSSFIAGFIIEYLGNSYLLFFCCGGFILISILFILNKRVNEL